MDLIFKMADHLMKTRFESLPREVIEKTKLFILDSFGVAMAGAGAPGVRQVAELMAELAGKPESTALYFGNRLTAMDAVLVNSMMIQALDLDDVYIECGMHPSCVQVPVAFSLAELCTPIHGRDLITAIALGTDISCRLAFGLTYALTKDHGIGFVRSGICGIFGAVANAAKLRKCTKEQIIHAMGIAFSQTAGNAQAIVDGALVKRMQPGFMARDGLFSVFLAERGITGPENIIEGEYGFLELYKRGEISPERITKDLGKIYEGVNVGVKFYVGGRFIHGPAEMAIELSKNNNLTADRISEMTIYLPKTAHDYCGKPFDLNRGNPQVMAQFCAAYAAAAGIVRRSVFIGEFDEKVIRDPIIGELARKTRVVVDEAVKDPAKATPMSLEIKTKDGKRYSKTLQHLKGDPQNFLSKEEFVGKFRRCIDFCPSKLPEENIEKVIDLIENLENVSDVGIIPKLLVKKGEKEE